MCLGPDISGYNQGRMYQIFKTTTALLCQYLTSLKSFKYLVQISSLGWKEVGSGHYTWDTILDQVENRRRVP